jgi:GT2 family glycosyltransferase
MTTPSVSVFIVNYSTCSLLEECLESIFDTKDDLAVEVFVADNNSTDGSPEAVKTRFPQVSLTRHSQNMGYTRAINLLLPLAKGKYCLLVHPDVELLPNTLKQFVEFFESHPQAGILGGNLYYPDGTPNPCEILFPGFKNDLLCFAVRLFNKLPGGTKLVGNSNPMEWSHRSTSKVNWVWNACMMIRREVFDRIGYFDDHFFVWYADWDLCKRATDEGWSVYYVHSATAIHHECQSFAKEGIIRDDVRYKVDGWYSAPQQTHDRHVFVKKYSSPASVYGIKTIYLVENVLRLWLILGGLLFRKATFKEVSFQLSACLQTIHTIMKA